MFLAKRIIPCLDVKAGRTVKGVNFENLRDAGDIVELAGRYSDEGADELVFLDITAELRSPGYTVGVGGTGGPTSANTFYRGWGNFIGAGC